MVRVSLIYRGAVVHFAEGNETAESKIVIEAIN